MKTDRVSIPVVHDHFLQHEDPQILPPNKTRRITRSLTAKVRAMERNEKFDLVAGPVLSSEYLRWYEAENFSRATKACRAVWVDQREAYPDCSALLRELNNMNCTNRCRGCEQVILLKRNRKCCSVPRWTVESAKRKPNFEGVVDILLCSGFLTWRERGGIRRISKGCYKVQKEQCTCRRVDQVLYLHPCVSYDPRFSEGYEKMNICQKCRALAGYTSWLIKNLHSFYHFDGLTDPSRLPAGLGSWPWLDVHMVTLQRYCPRRYAFVMNIVSLYIAQGELQRSPPTWYASAFLGKRHDPARGYTYEELLAGGISEYCLPATDEVLSEFLRGRCYPSIRSQGLLGPLAETLSIFSPFMKFVPMDSTKKCNFPRSFEHLSDEVIDSMSIHFLCAIS